MQTAHFLNRWVWAATNIGEVFDAFVNLKSQSPNDLVKALTNPVAVTGYKALRERPILNFSDNRSAILDPVTYFDTLTISPLFAVVKQAGRPERMKSLVPSAWHSKITQLDFSRECTRPDFSHDD